MANNATHSRISSPLLLAEHPCLRLGRQRWGLQPYCDFSCPFASDRFKFPAIPFCHYIICYNKSTACSTRPTNDSVDKYACRFTDYKTCHSVCAEPIQCFAPKLSASLGLYLIIYKELTLALKIWWLCKYLHHLGNEHLLVCVIPIALVSFRTSLARTMCYVVIHILMWSR